MSNDDIQNFFNALIGKNIRISANFGTAIIDTHYTELRFVSANEYNHLVEPKIGFDLYDSGIIATVFPDEIKEIQKIDDNTYKFISIRFMDFTLAYD